MRRKLALGAAVLVVSAPFMPNAGATAASTTQSVSVPVSLSMDATIPCTNSGGPTVTLDGAIGVGSTAVAVWYQNNAKGTHSTDPGVTGLDVEVTPSAGTVTLPKQPIPLDPGSGATGTGAGGNPWISVDVGSWNTAHTAFTSSIGGPVLIGRCVQGSTGFVTHHVDGAWPMSVPVNVLVQSLSCLRDSSSLTVTNSSTFGGVDALILFDNNKNKAVHEAQAAGMATANLLAPYTAHKGGNANGAGGNPLVYLQFRGDKDVDAQGAPQTDATKWTQYSPVGLGRCNKLGA